MIFLFYVFLVSREMPSMCRLSDQNSISFKSMSPKLVPQILQLNFVIKFILYLMTLNQIYAGAQYSN